MMFTEKMVLNHGGEEEGTLIHMLLYASLSFGFSYAFSSPNVRYTCVNLDDTFAFDVFLL